MSIRIATLLFAALCLGIGIARAAPNAADEIAFFVIVKSSNHAQDADGNLKLLNYHFFAEIFPRDGAKVRGTLESKAFKSPKQFLPHGKSLYVEGGHFQTQADVDRAYPNGIYRFRIQTPSLQLPAQELRLSGPGGQTDIPAPIRITLLQDGQAVSPNSLDPAKDLLIRWTPFSNGRTDPKGLVDDMIFVVVQDCHGKRIVHTGLPFEGNYMRFDKTEIALPAGTLKPGQPYAMFVEMPHVADSAKAGDVPGFASFATATYLDFRTGGTAADACPSELPAMDTGQTDRKQKKG